MLYAIQLCIFIGSNHRLVMNNMCHFIGSGLPFYWSWIIDWSYYWSWIICAGFNMLGEWLPSWSDYLGFFLLFLIIQMSKFYTIKIWGIKAFMWALGMWVIPNCNSKNKLQNLLSNQLIFPFIFPVIYLPHCFKKKSRTSFDFV